MDRLEGMYQAIKQKVIDLEIDPTQPIDEKALVRETGGSLTLVQQALERLDKDGIVVKERGRWHVARAATTSIMREIYEVGIVLEGMCARLAAERITAEQIERMEQAYRDYERIIRQGDNKALMAVDRRFHGLLYEASSNRFLARALDDMYTMRYRLVHFAPDRMGSLRPSVEEHREILAAVKAGDGRSAERLIQRHITQFQKTVEELF